MGKTTDDETTQAPAAALTETTPATETNPAPVAEAPAAETPADACGPHGPGCTCGQQPEEKEEPLPVPYLTYDELSAQAESYFAALEATLSQPAMSWPAALDPKIPLNLKLMPDGTIQVIELAEGSEDLAALRQTEARVQAGSLVAKQYNQLMRLIRQSGRATLVMHQGEDAEKVELRAEIGGELYDKRAPGASLDLELFQGLFKRLNEGRRSLDAWRVEENKGLWDSLASRYELRRDLYAYAITHGGTSVTLAKNGEVDEDAPAGRPDIGALLRAMMGGMGG